MRPLEIQNYEELLLKAKNLTQKRTFICRHASTLAPQVDKWFVDTSRLWHLEVRKWLWTRTCGTQT